VYDLLSKTQPPKRKRIKTAGSLKCPYGWKWLIVGGKISHVNGTDSVFTNEFENVEINKVTVEGDFATGYVGLYQQQMIQISDPATPAATAIRELGGSYVRWIVGYGSTLKFAGGANSYVDLYILEVPEQP